MAYPDGGQVPYRGTFKVTSPQGPRVHPITGQVDSIHKGIDIVGITSKTLYSPVVGTVAHVGWQSTNHALGYGYYVSINERNTNRRFYFGHMSANSSPLRVGQLVQIGDILGTEGDTGGSRGSHCHYEVRTNGTASSISTATGVPNKRGTYTSTLSGTFQGNDILGGVGKLDMFLQVSGSFIGSNGTDSWKYGGVTSGQPWSAAFVIRCARQVQGILNVVIPNSTSVSDMARSGVLRSMGSWLPGPVHGKTPTAKPGDLIFFRTSNVPRDDDYSSDRVGIVSDFKDKKVYCVEGDSGGTNPSNSKVVSASYSMSSPSINGYLRLNWDLVGDGEAWIAGYGPLYDTISTREDAISREVAYITSSGKPSITSTGMRLSIINYTTLLAAFVDTAMGGVAIENPMASGPEPVGVLGTTSNMVGSSMNADTLAATPRNIVNFLIGKGLNAAAAVGVIGNIQAECDFRIYLVGDNGTSFGMCQWHKERGAAMKKMAGANWATNLTGQCNYLWHELTTSYKKTVLTPMQQVPNTLAGAKQAADIFVRKFEKPASVDSQSVKRQANAAKFWSQLAPQLVPSGTNLK